MAVMHRCKGSSLEVLAMDAQHAFGAEEIRPLLPQQLTQPGVELAGVQCALRLDGD